MTYLRIRRWAKHFENNRTKELKNMSWIPIPNAMDNEGYLILTDHQNGAAHFGIWIACLEISSKCEPRGSLLRHPEDPHTPQSLARISHLPAEIWQEAIIRLLVIGWLEQVVDDKVVEYVAAPACGNTAAACGNPAPGCDLEQVVDGKVVGYIPAAACGNPAAACAEGKGREGREGKEGKGKKGISPSASPPPSTKLRPPECDPEEPPPDEESSPPAKRTRRPIFKPPTLDEVRAYVAEIEAGIDPKEFCDHYQANGWVQGNRGKPIVDWRACVRTWKARQGQFGRLGGNGEPYSSDAARRLEDAIDKAQRKRNKDDAKALAVRKRENEEAQRLDVKIAALPEAERESLYAEAWQSLPAERRPLDRADRGSAVSRAARAIYVARTVKREGGTDA